MKEKEKEEIKNLIYTIEYCHVYLAMLTTHNAIHSMQDRAIDDTTTTKITEIEMQLKNARQKLRELGVY